MKHLFLIITLAVASLSISATEVTTSAAGEVAALLGDNAATVTTLSVNGPVNATDLHYISRLSSLTTLDLSKAEIEAEVNGRLATNVSHYQANSLPAYILAGGSFSTIHLPDNLAEIEAGALMSTPIRSITIPASVKKIGTAAFADCKELTRIIVPATVESAGAHVCDGDVSLERVIYQAQVIPAYAFRGCTALTSVDGNPSAVGDFAFAGCALLQEFPFTPGLTAIGSGAFYSSGLTSAPLDGCRKLTVLGSYAFARCNLLTSASLPESLPSIGEGVFFDDTLLSTLTLPAGLDYLPDFALKGTESLSSPSLLNEGLTTIGRYAMAGMTGMESATLPGSLESIGDNAMEGMTGLNHINARDLDRAPELGADVWAGVDRKSVILYVNETAENDFLAAGQWNDFTISTSGLDPTVAIDTPEVSLNFSVNADAIEIDSSTQVKQAVIYNAAGTLLLSSTPATSVNRLTLPLAGISPQVLLVTITTATPDGPKVTTFKIAR